MSNEEAVTETANEEVVASQVLMQRHEPKMNTMEAIHEEFILAAVRGFFASDNGRRENPQSIATLADAVAQMATVEFVNTAPPDPEYRALYFRLMLDAVQGAMSSPTGRRENGHTNAQLAAKSSRAAVELIFRIRTRSMGSPVPMPAPVAPPQGPPGMSPQMQAALAAQGVDFGQGGQGQPQGYGQGGPQQGFGAPQPGFGGPPQGFAPPQGAQGFAGAPPNFGGGQVSPFGQPMGQQGSPFGPQQGGGAGLRVPDGAVPTAKGYERNIETSAGGVQFKVEVNP